MPSFKSLTSGLLKRTKSSDASAVIGGTTQNDDSPEGTAARGVRLFCESGAPNNQGEEVLHLPVIVDAAESSPAAAAAAAYQIRKFLKSYDRPHVQYNAIMLMRILAENPGPSFTKNIDSKFVSTVVEVLKQGRDPSVQQILRETLDAFDQERHEDEGLKKLLEAWQQNRGRAPHAMYQTQWQNFGNVPQQNPQSVRGQLPGPVELASRLEESKNTAKILQQLVQSTQTEDVLANELIKEFAGRCQSAQRSMQNYINADNPAPDHETMQTLIEVNEQLSLAQTRYQRAVLSARRATGALSNTGSPTPEQQHIPPTGPPPSQQQYQAPAGYQNNQLPPHAPSRTGAVEDNPFADSAAERSDYAQRGAMTTASGALPETPSGPTHQPVYRY